MAQVLLLTTGLCAQFLLTYWGYKHIQIRFDGKKITTTKKPSKSKKKETIESAPVNIKEPEPLLNPTPKIETSLGKRRLGTVMESKQ